MKISERIYRVLSALPGLAKAASVSVSVFMLLTAVFFAVGSAEETGDCTLCIQYMDEDTPIAGTEFRAYRVADLLEHGEYALAEPFEDSGVKLQSQMTHSAWEEAAAKFADCVKKGSLDPKVSGQTGGDGSLTFQGLAAGLYLVEGSDLTVGERVLQPQEFCVVLPGLDLDGNPEYNVTAAPKYEEKRIPEETEKETEAATEPEKETEAVTEPAQETEAVTETEKVTEAVTEPAQETEAVTETEKVTEAATEPEQETEAVTETEKVTEAATETEKATEAMTEPVQETEPATEAKTETETATGNETEGETGLREKPALTIEKEQSLNAGRRTKNLLTAKAFDVITYYLTVKNVSAADATAVVVTDAIPQGLTLKNSSDAISDGGVAEDGVIMWNLGTLAANASRTVSFQLATPRVEKHTVWKNTASVNYGENDGPAQDSNTVEAEEDPIDMSRTGNVIVTKELTYNGCPLAAKNSAFYVALYTDEECTVRATELKELRFEDSSSESATFEGLEAGRTYYAGESDAQGNVFLSGMVPDGTLFTVVFGQGSGVRLDEANETKNLNFENAFLDIPSDYMREGRLTITKQVLGADGEPEESDETFYAGIFADEAHTVLADSVSQNIVELPMDGHSETSVSIRASSANEESLKLYVAEVTADGTPVGDDFGYVVTVEDGEPEFSVDQVENTVKIINRRPEETSTEKSEESGEGQTEGRTEKPGEGQPGRSSELTSSTTSVKTGDDTPVERYVLLILSAGLACMLLYRRRRRRDMTEE